MRNACRVYRACYVADWCNGVALCFALEQELADGVADVTVVGASASASAPPSVEEAAAAPVAADAGDGEQQSGNAGEQEWETMEEAMPAAPRQTGAEPTSVAALAQEEGADDDDAFNSSYSEDTFEDEDEADRGDETAVQAVEQENAGAEGDNADSNDDINHVDDGVGADTRDADDDAPDADADAADADADANADAAASSASEAGDAIDEGVVVSDGAIADDVFAEGEGEGEGEGEDEDEDVGAGATGDYNAEKPGAGEGLIVVGHALRTPDRAARQARLDAASDAGSSLSSQDGDVGVEDGAAGVDVEDETEGGYRSSPARTARALPLPSEPTDRHRRALGGVPFVESTLPGQCLPVVWGVTSLLGGFFSFPSRRPCVLCLCRPRRRCSHVLHPCALRAQSLPSCL